MLNYNWSEDSVNQKLEEAEKNNVIKRCYVNNKISYRLVKDTSSIADNSVDVKCTNRC